MRKGCLACFLAACVPLVACGSDDGASAVAEGALGRAPDATLTFDGSHKESASAPLKAGSRVRIQYAPERLPSCRSGFNDGSPAWVITGYASLNGGEAQSFHVAGHNARGGSVSELPVVDVPTGGDLAMWFQVSDRYGCSAYDSNYGQNFHFSVSGGAPTPPQVRAHATFGPSGPVQVAGALVAGDLLELSYDPARLPACRGGLPNGLPAWTITGFAMSNGGTPRPFHVAGFNSIGGAAASPVRVPLTAAGDLALWFQVTSAFGCSEYDSNGSQNYVLHVDAR